LNGKGEDLILYIEGTANLLVWGTESGGAMEYTFRFLTQMKEANKTSYIVYTPVNLYVCKGHFLSQEG
jgi:hypothetical protein